MDLRDLLKAKLPFTSDKAMPIYGAHHNGKTRKELVEGIIESLQSYLTDEEIQAETPSDTVRYHVTLEIFKEEKDGGQ